MTDTADYVKEYFDRHAKPWLEQAYLPDELPAAFPVGSERIRVALEAVAEARGGLLVDLGCGGGHLCVHAARLGFDVVGVDVAPGMVAEAEALRVRLEPGQAERVRLLTGGYQESGVPDGAAAAVTAMGLIEYLPADDGLLAEAARLLQPGGALAVSCRNRLFNLYSANEYTKNEIESDAGPLLEELRDVVARTRPGDLEALARELSGVSESLVRAAEADGTDREPGLFHHPSTFVELRRQHSPRQLAESGARHGLTLDHVVALHPHPLPPALEALAPRVYNQLAFAFQRALERSPLGLAYASSYVGVLTRR